jgi:cytoskeleton protein RodZ
MGIGARLREEREKKGFLLADLADFLRIQETYLAEIEADNFAPMLKTLGSAYVYGFIRTYARQLGVDPDQAAAEFKQEQVESVNMPPLIVRQPIEEQRLPSWRLIAVAGVGLIVVVLVWNYLHADHDTVSEAVPPVPDRYTESPVPQIAASPPVQRTVTQQTVVQTAPAGESEDSDEATDIPQQSDKNPLGLANSSSAAIAATGASLGAGGPTRVAIHAVENSWVQIYDASGTAVFTGILHAGETYRVPDQPGYTMTAGNAGGIEISVDEAARPPLGATGQVMRGISLDAGRVR